MLDAARIDTLWRDETYTVDPATVVAAADDRDRLRRALDRLPPAQHDVLTAASVLGRRFGLSLLEGVTGGNGDLRGSLHELQRLDLVREGRRWPQPEYRFKHALIQEAAYRTILTGRRTALHRRAAEWRETRYAGNEEEVLGLLAHHWAAADDEEKAVAYLYFVKRRTREETAHRLGIAASSSKVRTVLRSTRPRTVKRYADRLRSGRSDVTL